MEYWTNILGIMLPVLATMIAVWVAVTGVYWAFRKHTVARRLGATLTLAVGGVLVVFVAASTAQQGGPQNALGGLFAIFTLLLTTITAVASTTFISNAMAGLLLGTLRSFRPGDFIQTEGLAGRVTECGLFRTEMQTEDSDLVTLPNLYLITRPIKVVRSQGTVVSAHVSLGYDLHHDEIRRLLIQAAEEAGLEDPFVQILDLGDFSIKYRAAGRLSEVQHLLKARSRLRSSILNVLHRAQVEIVSPAFMNQRQLQPDHVFLPQAAPKPWHRRGEQTSDDSAPDEVVFEKAFLADNIEQLRERIEKLSAGIRELEKQPGGDDGGGSQLDIAWRQRWLRRLQNELDAATVKFEALKARGD